MQHNCCYAFPSFFRLAESILLALQVVLQHHAESDCSLFKEMAGREELGELQHLTSEDLHASLASLCQEDTLQVLSLQLPFFVVLCCISVLKQHLLSHIHA